MELLFGNCGSHSWTSGDKKAGVLRRTFWKGSEKKNLACREDPIAEKHFSKFFPISFFLDRQQKVFGCLAKFLVVCQNCLPRVYGRHLEEKKFEWKLFFLSTSDFELLILGFLEKNRTGHQICFVRVKRNFLAKVMLRKKLFLITFGFSSGKSRIFGGIFSYGWTFCEEFT